MSSLAWCECWCCLAWCVGSHSCDACSSNNGCSRYHWPPMQCIVLWYEWKSRVSCYAFIRPVGRQCRNMDPISCATSCIASFCIACSSWQSTIYGIFKCRVRMCSCGGITGAPAVPAERVSGRPPQLPVIPESGFQAPFGPPLGSSQLPVSPTSLAGTTPYHQQILGQPIQLRQIPRPPGVSMQQPLQSAQAAWKGSTQLAGDGSYSHEDEEVEKLLGLCVGRRRPPLTGIWSASPTAPSKCCNDLPVSTISVDKQYSNFGVADCSTAQVQGCHLSPRRNSSGRVAACKEAMKVGTKQQLADFLGQFEPQYREYAAPLWASGVTSAPGLAETSLEGLVAAGIKNPSHALSIKVKAGEELENFRQLIIQQQTNDEQRALLQKASLVPLEAMEFDSEQQLAALLGRFRPKYRSYAVPLWASGVTSVDQLAEANLDDLVAKGIRNSFHAWHIKFKSGELQDDYRQLMIIRQTNKQQLGPLQKVVQLVQDWYSRAFEETDQAKKNQEHMLPLLSSGWGSS